MEWRASAVEDCIDKIGLASSWCFWRTIIARMISSGAPITIDRDNATRTRSSLRESPTDHQPGRSEREFIPPLQKFVEVDGRREPDRSRWSPPLLRRRFGSYPVRPHVSEEELLRGLEGPGAPGQEEEDWSRAGIALAPLFPAFSAPASAGVLRITAPSPVPYRPLPGQDDPVCASRATGEER